MPIAVLFAGTPERIIGLGIRVFKNRAMSRSCKIWVSKLIKKVLL